MTTKRLVGMIGGAMLGLALVGALVVAVLVGATYYTIGQSQAAQTAKRFLRQNERLRRDIGPVRDFGWFVSGSINTQSADGTAQLGLKVIGARRTVPATVAVAYRHGRDWRVVSAAYKDAAGRTTILFDPADEPVTIDAGDEPAAPPATPPATQVAPRLAP